MSGLWLIIAHGRTNELTMNNEIALRLRDTVESAASKHNKIHFTTKHVRYAHMLASYLNAVQTPAYMMTT